MSLYASLQEGFILGWVNSGSIFGPTTDTAITYFLPVTTEVRTGASVQVAGPSVPVGVAAGPPVPTGEAVSPPVSAEEAVGPPVLAGE